MPPVVTDEAEGAAELVKVELLLVCWAVELEPRNAIARNNRKVAFSDLLSSRYTVISLSSLEVLTYCVEEGAFAIVYCNS